MHEVLLAVVRPGNTPHGYNLTFAFPMLMFIIIAGVLFLRFRGAHNVPGHAAITSSRWAGTGETAGTGTVNSGDQAAHAPADPGASAATGGAGEPAADGGQVRPAQEGTEEGE